MAEKGFPLNVVLKAIDRVSGPLKGIAGRIQAFGNTVSAVRGKFSDLSERSGLTNLTEKVVGLGGALKGVGDGVTTAATRIAGLAAATGIASGGLVVMAQAYADATGAIGDTAERTGISRERFQELSFAAQLSGSSAETLGGALQKMNLAVGKAAEGSKDLKEMFAGLGIRLKNSNGTLKTTDELFNTFVDRISKIKDPSLQAQAAVKVFGKSATELLPLIRGGTAGLGEMADQARKLGVVISDDAVREGEEFGDVLDMVKMAMAGVGNTVAGILVPQLNKLGNTLIETIVKYRPQIEAFATAFAENLPGNIERVTNFLSDLYNGIQPVVTAVDWLSDSIGGANVVLIALGLYIGGPLLVSLISLGTSIVSVATAMSGPLMFALKAAGTGFLTLGKAILTTPLGWFLAAIAAVGAAAYIIYDNWEQIGDFFTEKWASVKAAFSDGIINGMVKVWQEYNPATLMMEAFNGLIKYLTGWDLGAILREKITAAVSAISSSLPDWAKSLLGIDGAAVTVAATQPAPGQPVASLGQQAATAGGATPVGQRAAAIGQQAAQTALAQQQAVRVEVDIKNAPQGTRTTTSGTPGAKFDTNIGYAMGAPN